MKLSSKMIGALLLLISSLLLTGCAPKTFEGKVDMMGGMVSSYLDLNDEQEKALDVIGETVKVTYPEFKNFRATFKTSLKEELKNDNFDVPKMTAEMQALEAEVLAVSDEIVGEFAAFHQLLTPEQKNKIAEHRKDGRKGDRRRGHFGRGHGWDDDDHQGKRRHRDLGDFDLQPEQVQALKKLVAGIAADSVDLMVSNHQLKKSLKAQMASQTFDAAQTGAQLKESVKLFFATVYRRLPEFAAFHAVLAPEQRDLLVAHVDLWGQGPLDDDEEE